jgi:hypothetical protein
VIAQGEAEHATVVTAPEGAITVIFALAALPMSNPTETVRG